MADILVGAVIGYRPCSVAHVTHRFVLCDAIFFYVFYRCAECANSLSALPDTNDRSLVNSSALLTARVPPVFYLSERGDITFLRCRMNGSTRVLSERA